MQSTACLFPFTGHFHFPYAKACKHAPDSHAQTLKKNQYLKNDNAYYISPICTLNLKSI